MNQASVLRLLFLSGILFFSFSANAQWAERQFGHWTVTAVHDPMDAVSHVIMRTHFARSKQGALDGEPARYRFGLRIFGGQLMTLAPDLDLGKEWWPHCDMNLSTFSIDEGPPQLIAITQRGGSCNSVPLDGSVVSGFKRASVARVRLNKTNGYISLHGFSAAWEFANSLAR